MLKIRDLKRNLAKAGFIEVRMTGDHARWKHPKLPESPLTIAGKDHQDAPKYIVARAQKLIQLAGR